MDTPGIMIYAVLFGMILVLAAAVFAVILRWGKSAQVKRVAWQLYYDRLDRAAVQDESVEASYHEPQSASDDQISYDQGYDDSHEEAPYRDTLYGQAAYQQVHHVANDLGYDEAAYAEAFEEVYGGSYEVYQASEDETYDEGYAQTYHEGYAQTYQEGYREPHEDASSGSQASDYYWDRTQNVNGSWY